jgi:aspartate racemase
MTQAGIIGGIGPESTIAYYRHVVAGYRARTSSGEYPALIINSIDFSAMLALLERDDRAGLIAFLLTEVEALARAGAEIALLAANTPHIVFDELQRRASIRLLSIVQVTCRTAQAQGLRRLALFGTRFTMQGSFYADVFSSQGIELVLPDPQEQAYIHDKYMHEWVNGLFDPDVRQHLLDMVQSLKQRERIDGVILGGTELPLILTDNGSTGIPFLDTTAIHAAALVEQLLAT